MKNTNYKGVIIEIRKGDLTEENSDAIINPANSFMIMGGGVAYAIKKKGGVEIENEAKKFAPVNVGNSVMTNAGKLRAKFVIHSPTMENPAMKTKKEKVYKATFSAIKLASDKGLKSISFPAMGAGVGGLSYTESAEAMFQAIKDAIDKDIKIEEITIVLIDEYAVKAFLKMFYTIFKE